MTSPGEITAPKQLRDVYAAPARPAVAKQIDHLDEHCRALIAHSPFFVLATAGTDGTADASPRGGPPGFVRVLDEHHLAFGDLAGNNRLDSYENIAGHHGVGMLFFLPGRDETLRVNGTATLSTDDDLLDACMIGDIRPRLVVHVRVDAAYIHCAKALLRSRLWHTDSWPDLSALPSTACMLRDHYGLPELDLAGVEKRLEESYRSTTWLAGGKADASPQPAPQPLT